MIYCGIVKNSRRIKQVSNKKCIVPWITIKNFSFNCKKYTPCCNNTVLHVNTQKKTFLGDRSFLSQDRRKPRSI